MSYPHGNRDHSYQNRDDPPDLIHDPYGTPSMYRNPGTQPNVSDQQHQQQFIQQRPFSPKNNQIVAKNYNDFLERQGIPAISPEDIRILRECGRESLIYRCKLLFLLFLILVKKI